MVAVAKNQQVEEGKDADTVTKESTESKQADIFSNDASKETFGGANLKPKITVFGVGGGGGNAVNNMIRSGLEGVGFVVANTDAQALNQSLCPSKIQLGLEITSGLGAGARPDVGKAAAEEAIDELVSFIKNSNMVFITAGMGGGTGTGAAPVIARIAKEHGVLTIGVVTKPFHFEGTNRMRLAERGIDELQRYVDTLIVIPNQNLFRIADERTTFADAFRMADDVLRSGVQGVTDLMIMPGLINLDFADIKTVMSEMGKAMMGTGDAEGEKRAIDAAEAAISNPLLDDVSMKGARGILINITGGYDMTLYEVDEAANRIREEVDPEANIIFGSTFNEKMNGHIRVSVVATGIDAATVKQKIRELETQSQSLEGATTNTLADESSDKAIVGDSTPNKAVEGGANTTTLGRLTEEQVKTERSAISREQVSETKKHKPSFLERLAGTFSSRDREDVEKDSPVVVTTTMKKQQPSNEEDLEIPAFLRRNS